MAQPKTAFELKRATISFHSVEDFPGFDNRATDWFSSVVNSYNIRDILEVGAGGNPAFSRDERSALNLSYVANDVSSHELQKTGDTFEQWVFDLSAASVPDHMQNRFDMVFSKMVNEHVSDGRAYHTNIHRLLKPGGISAHCFPTLYSLPFLVNRLVPDFVSNLLVKIFMPVREVYWNGKFKAYYSWSRGPSKAMIERFESIGFRVIDYRGYFGHGYYHRIPPIHILEIKKSRFLAQHPVPLMCSYGTLILQKV